MALTEYERNVRTGLRAVRRVERRLDTQQERLQRILRRLYLRKTVPRKVAEVQSVMNQYGAIEKALGDLNRTMADWVNVIGGYAG